MVIRMAMVCSAAIMNVLMADPSKDSNPPGCRLIDVDVTGADRSWTVNGNTLTPPAPFPSWLFRGGRWEAPRPRPQDVRMKWDENASDWVPDSVIAATGSGSR